MLRFVYTIFIGLLIAAFVGVGIDAFYPGPTAPEYPDLFVPEKSGTEISEEQIQQQKEYEKAFDEYQIQARAYNRNVSIIAMVAAVIILAASFLVASQSDEIADGTILGGVLTLGYAIIRGFNAEDAQFRFLTITVGLAVTLLLGYFKFFESSQKQKHSSKN